MFRVEKLVESRPAVLSLTLQQSSELVQLSKDLAGQAAWWGEDDDWIPDDRGVIRIENLGGSEHRITVLDAVGAIGLTDLSLIVHPKIPIDHFSFITSHAAGAKKRKASPTLALAEGPAFLDLMASWFLDDLERIVRMGIRRDYESVEGSIPSIRGRLDLSRTAIGWLRGSTHSICQFDEFSLNNAPNRVLKSAAVAIAQNRSFPDETRRRAEALVRKFVGVGVAGRQDLKKRIGRDFRGYSDAHLFAKEILRGAGRVLEHGTSRARSFLLKTPDLIEGGLRQILTQGLAPIEVTKRGKVLVPSPISVNPDLLLGPPPFTGDVKYKLSKGTWNRPDLAQSVLFATAFKSPRALVLSFFQGPPPQLDNLRVGDLTVCAAFWDASTTTSPEESALKMVKAVKHFVEEEALFMWPTAS